MTYFITHLLSREGFPLTRISFGRGWDGTLLLVSIGGEGLYALAYVVFIAVFVVFYLLLQAGRINPEAGKVHAPRVAFTYAISTIITLLAHIVNIYCFWVPLYRLAGLFVFLGGAALFVASLKSLWALMLSIQTVPEAGE